MIGRDIAVGAEVRLLYRPGIDGMITELDTSDWADRAVVVDTIACGCNGDCRILTVIPDEWPDTRETVHADADTEYPLWHPPA
jgi:hypothetical protein